ncbi:hypothetical protein AAG570_014052 [Ranatra chinensis]|uniref:acetylglutamate kinase n=1 Tax=Ranatra chinensis TaxID=642074 RepID=A0ABD0XSB8_9HEMI
MQRYFGKTVVIKYGGNAMVDEALKYHFAQDMVLLKHVGINPVIVHGGGPQIGGMLNKLNIESRFYQGMRITSAETMDIVEMILSGKVNKEIVGLISKSGGQAVGLSGRDANLLNAEKLTIEGEDIGQVGDVTTVNTSVLDALKDFIPVIAPVGIGKGGQAYNINADIAAGSIAAALKAEKLLLLTDVEGILNEAGERISSVTLNDIHDMTKRDIIKGGMIPKLKGAIDALSAGVSKVHIIDGRLKHSVLLELFTDAGIGTEILNG